jgi:hypothetical protein
MKHTPEQLAIYHQSKTPVIDAEIKQNLLRYPTLFATRFSVLVNMFSTSNYIWKDGQMVRWGGPEYEDLDTMDVDVYKKNVVESQDSVCEEHPYEAEYELMLAKWREANVEMLARTFCNTNSREILHELRYGGNNLEWTCFSLAEIEECFGPSVYPRDSLHSFRPEEISEEWRFAVREFLREITPVLNSYWGYMDENDGNKWKPREDLTKSQRGFFLAVYKAIDNLITDEERANQARVMKDISAMLDEIEAEEKDD